MKDKKIKLKMESSLYEKIKKITDIKHHSINQQILCDLDRMINQEERDQIERDEID